MADKLYLTNKFYFYAQKYAENLTTDAEIRNIDMTAEFWDEVEQEIINDELVDININAKVRMSKSTTGINAGLEIFRLLLKHKKRKEGEFGLKNIARDDQEFSKIMRDPNTAFTVIVTDEINDLEKTGENVTVEKALYNDFSNVQAGRYVHRVSCSPKDATDPNADIFLEIVSVDRQKKITHAHLYYKMFKGGNEYMQLLGYVDFYVGELIKVWDGKVKKHFLKPEKTKYDENIIKYWRKRDFYTEYMCRKYEKMELITKEGIMRPRMLDYAEVIIKVEGKLRPLTRLNILNKSTIKNFIKKYCREAKIPTSIVGEELMTQEVDGILNLWKSYFKIVGDYSNLEKRKGKMEDYEYQAREELLKNTMNELMTTIQAQLEELQRYKEINEKYNLLHNGRDNQENKETVSGRQEEKQGKAEEVKPKA